MDPIDLRGPACLALLSWGSLTSSFHEDALNMATCASRYPLKVLTHSHAGALCQRLYSCFVFSCDMLGELGSILTVSFQIYQECVSILSPLTRELGGGNFQGQAALDSRNGAVFLPHGSSSGS